MTEAAENRPPIDPIEYSRSLAKEEATLRDTSRREYATRWNDGLNDLARDKFRFNIAILLSDGVKSGLSLEESCAIALSVVYPESLQTRRIQRTLNALKELKGATSDK